MKNKLIKAVVVAGIAVLLVASTAKTSTHAGTGAETTITPTLLAAVR